MAREVGLSQGVSLEEEREEGEESLLSPFPGGAAELETQFLVPSPFQTWYKGVYVTGIQPTIYNQPNKVKVITNQFSNMENHLVCCIITYSQDYDC